MTYENAQLEQLKNKILNNVKTLRDVINEVNGNFSPSKETYEFFEIMSDVTSEVRPLDEMSRDLAYMLEILNYYVRFVEETPVESFDHDNLYRFLKNDVSDNIWNGDEINESVNREIKNITKLAGVKNN